MSDVTSAFVDLGDNYPGSRHKRRAVAGPAPVQDDDAQQRWDGHPTIIQVDGRDVEFFLIGALSLALQRRPVTIRKWISAGILPAARYRTNSSNAARGSRRLWTRSQIEGMARIAAEEGIFAGRPVSSTQFTSRVKELFRALRQSEGL